MTRVERVRLVARPPKAGSSLRAPRLSIVVPSFNEADRLPALLDSLKRYIEPASTEVLIVDDGSTDRTVAIAHQRGAWAPHLRVIEHAANRGKGAAVRTGVLQAQGELIAFVDADNATDLAALAPMCDAIQGHVGAVFGSRHAPGAHVAGSPPIRGLMGRVFNHAVKLAAGTSISDTQCGAKVFRASAARLVFAASAVDGFAFDVEVLRRLMDLGVGVIEYPVRWTYMPGTKIRPLTPFSMLSDIIRLRVHPTPMRFDTIVCRYEPAIDTIAECLDSSIEIRRGVACEILVPADAGRTSQQVIGALRQAGIEAEVEFGQSRS